MSQPQDDDHGPPAGSDIGIGIEVLGPLRVRGPNGSITVPGVKERTLLAVLTAHRGRTVPVHALATALWGEAPPRSAHKSLQTFVLRLRRALQPDRSAPEVLITDPGGYRLTLPPTAVDADRFADLVGSESPDPARPRETITRLTAALSLWRGPAYVDFATVEVTQAQARRLHELRLTATEDLYTATLAADGPDAVVPEMERLVGEHPYRERIWALLVLGLYRQGRQADALAAFDRVRRRLLDDLGVEPARELRELQARVLAQDPRLDPPGVGRLPTALQSIGPLIGREAELDRLLELWAAVRSGAAVLVVVRGPVQAGGLRLVQELAGAVTAAGDPVTGMFRGSPRPVSPAAPGLLVTDRPDPPVPVPGQLVVALAGPGDAVPAGAGLIDLQPLTPDAARALVARQVGPDDAERATAQILASTPAWPDLVWRAAAGWAGRAAAGRIRHESVTVARTSDELSRARARLADGVLALDAVEAAAPDPGLPPPESDTCPWRGLTAYDVADAPWFAGRERLVAELLARVAGSRLVALVGPSGSGKSSALRAGLIAGLQGGALPGSAGWTTLVLRPGAHPLRELTRQALRAGLPAEPVGELLERLIRSDDPGAGPRVVVAVDQTEELWTICPAEDERAEFLDALADLACDPASSVTVLLAVRPDYLAQLADHTRLAAALADNTVLVGTPTSAEIVRAIRRPAARTGLVVQDGLTEAIADDASGEPGLLPLLSTMLARLWAQREGRSLTLRGYVAVGGLTGAITGMAEAVYTALDPADRPAARMLLLRLAGPGAGSAVTRRRVPLGEIDGLPDPRVRAVVEPLAAARLLTVTGDSVEVAHEALFDRWPRLRAWLADDTANREVRRRLTAAAADWDGQERDPGLLWQGARLAAGRDAADADPDAVTQAERDFLAAATSRVDADRQAAEARAAQSARQVRRLRWLVAGIVLLLVGAGVVGVIAVSAQRRAETATASAEARRLAAQSVTEQHLDLGLLSAVEAVRADPGPDTDGALLTLLTRSPRIVTQVHAQGRFLRAAVSPDGATVYLAENGPVLHAYAAATGTEKWSVPLAANNELAADPAGRGLLTTMWPDGRQQIVLIDGTDGRPAWSTPAPAGNELGYGAAWLTDGRWVVAGTAGIVVGDGAGGRIDSQTPWPADLAGFLPDYVTAWPDGRVSLADATRTVVYDPATDSVTPFGAAGSIQAASSAGVLAAVDTTDPANPTIRLHDPTGALLGAPIPLTLFTGGLRFTDDGSELAVGAGQVLQLRDGHDGSLRAELPGHSGAIMGIVYAGSDRDLIWTAGRDGSGFVWDRTGQRGILRSASSPARTWLGDTDRSGTVSVGLSAPSGAYNWVSVLDPRTGALIHPELPLPAGCRWCEPVTVAITPDGRTAVAGLLQYPEVDGQPDYTTGAVPDRGYLMRWDTATGTLQGTTGLPWPPAGLAVTVDGRDVLVNGDRGAERIELAGGSPRWGPMPHTGIQDRDATRSVALSPDGRLALIGTGDGAQILDADSGRVLAETTFDEPDVASATAFSADGSTAIVGTYGGYLHVLSAADLTPTVPRRLTTGGWLVDLVASPDGRYVASTGGDGDLLLWDTTTWQPLGQPVADDDGWGFLRFDPDGRTLRAVHQWGAVVTFVVDPDAWIRQACQVANRDLTADEFAAIRPGEPWHSTCAGYR